MSRVERRERARTDRIRADTRAVLVAFAVSTLLAARVLLVLTASHQFDAIDNEFT